MNQQPKKSSLPAPEADAESARLHGFPETSPRRRPTPAFIPLVREDSHTPADATRLFAFQLRSALLPDPLHRQVLVHLPQAYLDNPHKRFPVFYLHDGQNLFDESTAYIPGHTWRAHTTADALAAAHLIEPVILVGVANTGLRRMAEYTPSRDPKLGGGDGDLYARLLIEELKPAIDHTFRTRTDAACTGLGGSSLGGLISLAIGFDHPGVFGKLALLSPSLWWNHQDIFRQIEASLAADARPHLRIWLDMGTAEGLRHLRDTDRLFQLLRRHGWREEIDLAYRRIEGASHTEDAWADRFGDVLRFLYPAL